MPSRGLARQLENALLDDLLHIEVEESPTGRLVLLG
jgi:hypothetical protein